ncbi:sensor domain-containing phosphodiesterase [Paracidovorax wautersii]|uniref:EAL domain-containing protein (Putative c-di-GMP-specific phosphodiesterase class I)/GAF domain-containing protein n=1 Tax=Paracidovorax wautersii TaxID=1177982 RepID=A0ABU1IBI6_9BURK|nr:sensor domain-containing phosphodiesterase [Paracidovorax wautersii]MDR6214575.1 EAL domain-containing protein (putative c-di-GMP-specific phosphodiesterase class I)/GAF domain-containing protein [Paracidovorax wautersii]
MHDSHPLTASPVHPSPAASLPDTAGAVAQAVLPAGFPDAAWIHEQERLFFLRSTGLLDSKASEAFDRITRLAAELFQVPIALVSLVEDKRQWFKSCVGLDTRQTDRSVSFCTHTIERGTALIVEDALQDTRFADNPLVTGYPGIRFYAGVPLRLPSGHALGSLCIIDSQPRSFSDRELQRLQDLGALVMAQIDLHQMAGRVNEVTRLPNRGQLGEDLQEACAAEPSAPRVLMLLDVMSHAQLQAAVRAVGVAPLESALRTIATKLVQTIPSDAALYHVGETRFAIVLAGGVQEDLSDVAAGMMLRMAEPFRAGAVTVQLELQAGLAPFTLVSESCHDVLRRATAALYQAGTEQRPMVWYGEQFDVPHRRAYALLRSIPSGLMAGDFRLVFQPKMNLHTGRVTAVEALARWRHPRHGDVPPSEFIEIMERTTLIHDFTEWILHRSLEQLSVWRTQGIELSMAVNVSARNLEHPRFLQALRNACALYQVHPQNLHIECTEHAVMTGTRTAATLEAVRAMGIGISLDDFGVGYSNLACLHSLPVQLLKLDQSLIKPIATDVRALKLVRSLLHMGHTLGYRLLAEGVESKEVFDILKREGCDAVQGYYLSRPLEAEDVPRFLQAAPRG